MLFDPGSYICVVRVPIRVTSLDPHPNNHRGFVWDVSNLGPPEESSSNLGPAGRIVGGQVSVLYVTPTGVFIPM